MKKLIALGATVSALGGLAALVFVHRADQRSADPRESIVPPHEVEVVPGNTLEVLSITTAPVVEAGKVASITARVRRGAERKGVLKVLWSHSAGSIAGRPTLSAKWLAPSFVGAARVRVKVSDRTGSSEAETPVAIRLPTPPERQGSHSANFQSTPGTEQTRRSREYLQQAAQIGEALSKPAIDNGAREELRSGLASVANQMFTNEDYAQAYEVFQRLSRSVLRNNTLYREYSASLGRAAYYLQKHDEAMRALSDAGPWRSGTDDYLLADLFERKGRRDDAIESYLKASEKDVWFGEPLYRGLELRLRRGDSPERVIDHLVEMSSRLDGERIVDRLGSDKDLSQLQRALLNSGRTSELRPKRPFRWKDGKRVDIELGDNLPTEESLDAAARKNRYGASRATQIRSARPAAIGFQPECGGSAERASSLPRRSAGDGYLTAHRALR